MLEVKSLEIPDVKTAVPRKFADGRGFFSETYNQNTFSAAGIPDVFVQDNHSYSADKGVIRGLHFQIPPRAQTKLVRVVRGSIFDVAVDLRQSSPTYGKWVSAELSAENWTCLYVPVGFAHGFCTLEPNTEVVYKVTDFYDPEHDKGLFWDDPQLGIEWPIDKDLITLSERDQKHPKLEQLPPYFE